MKRILTFVALSCACMAHASQEGLTIPEIQQALPADTIKVLAMTNLTTGQKEYWILNKRFALFFISQEDANKCIENWKDFLSRYGTITRIESRK